MNGTELVNFSCTNWHDEMIFLFYIILILKYWTNLARQQYTFVCDNDDDGVGFFPLL